MRGTGLCIRDRAERELDVRCARATAKCAVSLYSRGWLEQKRLGGSGAYESEAGGYGDRLTADVERQLSSRGYYVPFDRIGMVICRKLGGAPRGSPPG